MQSKITAIGTANPPFKRSQQETAELISEAFALRPAQKRILTAIYKASGIETRYSVISDFSKAAGEFNFFPNDPAKEFPTTAERMKLYHTHALPLALAAIKDCISNSDACDIKKITHLITVSCTGMYAPGIDIEIIQKLELNPSTKRTTVNFMGCYGAFNGLKIADAFCRAEPNAKVLLVCIELCSIHFQKNFALENLISNAIFSDGAAAVLVQAHSNHHKQLKINSFHCDLIPQTNQEMAWSIADYGFDIVLSSYVPKIIKTGIAAFTKKLLNQSNDALSEVDFYAIHPGGIKILQACEEALPISVEDNKHSYDVLRNFGNMSSATILFVLKNIWNSLDSSDDNKNIFSCAFGPGLTLESMLLTTQCN